MQKIIILLLMFFISFTINIFSQSQKISSAGFYAPIRAADTKRFKTSRREVKSLMVYSDGILKSRRSEIEEFLEPDKQRYVLVEKSSDKTKKLELVKIGSDYYQKKDDGAWTKEDNWNHSGRMSGIPIPVTSEYTVENTIINGQPAKLYKFFAIYNEINPKQGEEKLTSWEQKNWINDKGLTIREEITMAKPQSKEIKSHRIYEYDYNPKNLKIEAPIK